MAIRKSRNGGELKSEAPFNALRAFMVGDYSVRLPTDLTGVDGEIAETVNEFIGVHTAFTDGFVKAFEKVSEDGLLDSSLETSDFQGGLVEVGESLDVKLGKLTISLNEMMHITGVVARGDLSQRVPIVTNGKKKEGELTDQVVVPGISGIWMDFTEGINKP